MTVDVAIANSISTIFVPIMHTFDASRAETAVIQSTLLAVAFGFGVVSGWFGTRFGSRISGLVGASLITTGITASYFASSVTYLVVSVGVIPGIGVTLLYVSNTAATEECFEGRTKVVVISVLATGIGVGSMVYPYLLTYLNNVYGLRGTFLIVGGISANCIACCLLWNKHVDEEEREADDIISVNENHERSKYEFNGIYYPELADNHTKASSSQCANIQTRQDITDIDESLQGVAITTLLDDTRDIDPPDNITDTTNKKHRVTAIGRLKGLLKDKSLLAFSIGVALSNPIISLPMIFLTDVFRDKDYLEEDAVMGLFIMNFVSVFGRISHGLIIQSPNSPTMIVPLIASFIGALSLVGMILVPNLSASLIMCGVIGLCMGALLCMYSVVPVKLVERENLSTAIGILMTSTGIVILIPGPLSGLLRDVSNSYTIPFYNAAAILMIASFVYFVAHKTRKKPTATEGTEPRVHVATMS